MYSGKKEIEMKDLKNKNLVLAAIKGNKGHASLVAGIDEEAGDVDSMYQLVLQRKGNLSAIEDEMDGK